MPPPLATRRHCIERIRAAWPDFAARRAQRLGHGTVVERVAENILEDLFTSVLDWQLGDVKRQQGFADLELTHMGIKYLVLEAKRPGALAWSRRAVEAALEQALRYAAEQKVRAIAVSDGLMLYAADVKNAAAPEVPPPGALLRVRARRGQDQHVEAAVPGSRRHGRHQAAAEGYRLDYQQLPRRHRIASSRPICSSTASSCTYTSAVSPPWKGILPSCTAARANVSSTSGMASSGILLTLAERSARALLQPAAVRM